VRLSAYAMQLKLTLIRPIPDEMYFYARADTHYLLYIYDNMRNELIDRSDPDVPDENRIEAVLQKSKETSLFRFERQVYNEQSGSGPGGWHPLLVKTPALFNNQQFAVFRAVHAWRDKIARADDDSTAFVMPNHVIFSIAKLMPVDMITLLGIAHPISHSVKFRTAELLELIKSAKAKGNDGPSMMDVLRPDTVGAIAKANIPSVAAKSVPATLVAVVNEDELRSERSSFWGGAFGSSIWDAPAAVNQNDDLRLALPFPSLSSAVSASANGLTDRSKVQTASTVSDEISESTTPVKQPEDDAFIIKRGGMKRKSEAVSDADEDSTDEFDISRDLSLKNMPWSQEEQDAYKKKRDAKKAKMAAKAAKKERKQEKKRKEQAERAEAIAQSQPGNDAMEDDEPFDYGKAESVLHGQRTPRDQSGSKKDKKPFDPYAKSADSPKGMRRLQTERPGKSHTFKS
jgi:exosome complex exonuclease RRP6